MLACLFALLLTASDAGRHVAHAGGAIGGIDYSNAVEALDNSYLLGFRLFELDLSWTRDGQLVLVHDWDTKWRSLFQGSETPDHETFMAMAMRGGLTQMDLDDLMEWLRQHPDAHAITDAKERSADALRAIAAKSSAYDVRHRVIPQAYSFEEYALARKLGFERVILTAYRLHVPPQRIAEWAARERPWAVTVPADRVEAGTFDALLAIDGLFTYAHTVNDPDRWERLRGLGVDGIYTDTIAPTAGAAVPVAPEGVLSP